MTTHDPYTGKQIKFERTDRSGRYYPIEDEYERIATSLLQICGWMAAWVALVVALFYFGW